MAMTRSASSRSARVDRPVPQATSTARRAWLMPSILAARRRAERW